MTIQATTRSRERGSALVEFVLCFALFWTPLFFGTLVIGFSIIRAIQVTQVCRDAGHMYSYGIDFSQSSYRNLIVNLASGLHMTATGGNGVIILSTITHIGPGDCTAAGLHANASDCPNINQPVIVRRLVIGNASPSFKQSAFGTPNQSLIDSSGNVSTIGYLTDITARAAGFENLVPLTSGQFSYVSEMYVVSPDLDWWNFLGTPGISARSIF